MPQTRDAPEDHIEEKEWLAMPYPRYTPEEVAQRGEAIYERQIRARVEPEHMGQFVVIDIETGDYELDIDAGIPALGRGRGSLSGLGVGHAGRG